jgi:hypothetical protein
LKAGFTTAAILISMAIVAFVASRSVPSRQAARDDSRTSSWRTPAAAYTPSSATALEPSPSSAAPKRDAAPAPSIAELERRLEASEPGLRDIVLAETLPAMLRANVHEVARFAELQTDPILRERLIRETADHWVKTEPELAMDWVRTLPPSPEREATLIDMSLAIARTDPAHAATIRDGDVGNETPDGVLDGIVQQWAERDFDAAMRWANARPRNAQQEQLVQRLVYVRAATGAHEEAVRLAEDSFHNFDAKAKALAIVAQHWLKRDRAAARAWLDGLDPALEMRVMREVNIIH